MAYVSVCAEMCLCGRNRKAADQLQFNGRR